MKTITIKVTDDFTLDAGSVEETAEQFVIDPPTTPMIEQLLVYLETRPYHSSDVQTRHMAVGFTALCVRWGSYLATLMDPSTDLHPAIPGFGKEQPSGQSFISNGEMKRLNIEISHNIWRLIQYSRERGDFELWTLLTKARDYLPMPHKRVQMDRQAVREIYRGLSVGAIVMHRFQNDKYYGLVGDGSNGGSAPKLRQVAPEEADRVLANVLACQVWRSTIIEEIHGGKTPDEPLQPHQQRFNRRNQLALMREVTAKMGSIVFTMNTLFGPDHDAKGLVPVWPETATAMTYSFYGTSASDWSVTDSSSPVVLRKRHTK